MLKIRYLVGIGIVAYVIFFIAGLPAAWFSPYVDKIMAEKKINLTSVTGTLWKGRGELLTDSAAFAPLQGSQLIWNLRVLGLLKGQLQVDFQLTGGALQLQGQTQVGWKRFGVTGVSGEVSALFLNTLLVNSVKVSQPLQLNDVSLQLNRTKKPTIAALGSLFWPKGTLVLAQNSDQTLKVPDMVANLASIESDIQLIAKAENAEVLRIRVDANGLATVTVLQRMLVALGQSNGITEQDGTLFEITQAVF